MRRLDETERLKGEHYRLNGRNFGKSAEESELPPNYQSNNNDVEIYERESLHV